MCYLFATFPSVALAAQHLAIACDSTAAFYPRRYMICFHDFDIEGLTADGALTALLLIDLTTGVGIKGTDTEVVNVAI